MQRVFSKALAAVVMVTLAIPRSTYIHAQPNPASLSDQLTSAAAIDAYLSAHQYQGYILLARHGKAILSKAYGMADAADKVPNSIRTRWPMFGVESEMIAAAILKLQELGKLRVQDKLCAYLDHCPSAWRSITLHQVLTDTSGIAAYDPFNEKSPSIAHTIAVCRGLPLAYAPGTGSDGTICGRVLLSTVIARVAGQPFAAAMRDLIFRPAGLVESGLLPRAPFPQQTARGYDVGTPGIQVNVGGYPLIYAGAGDTLRLEGALLAGKIISAKSQRALFAPYLRDDPSGGQVYRGYGPILVIKATKITNAYVFTDSGPDNSGINIRTAIAPKDGAVAIIFINDTSNFNGDTAAAFQLLLEKLLGMFV
jgi:CubicO group peptidase (beta-lactamase class C family)